jgi:hypothetical protein
MAFGQSAQQGPQANLPNQPEALVRSLYTPVARHPLGIPSGADWKAFVPYMSKALLHRIDINVACQVDWDRQNPDHDSKPPFLEDGLFTGGNERAEPRTFHIERTESEKDGSFRVFVRLTWEEPQDKEIWRVAAVLVQENGRLVLDDVIYLRDEKDKASVDYRLSEYLSGGCDGTHWVGRRQNNQKQQR